MLIIFFIVLPVVEIYVFVQVSDALGFLPALALVVLSTLLGSALLRRQGRAAIQRFNTAVDSRRMPAREVADAAMIALGAFMLIIPGFVTSVFGLLLLFPPTRALVRMLGGAFLLRRFSVVTSTASWGYDRARRTQDDSGPGFDIEGNAQEVDPDGPSTQDRRDATHQLPPA